MPVELQWCVVVETSKVICAVCEVHNPLSLFRHDCELHVIESSLDTGGQRDKVRAIVNDRITNEPPVQVVL